MKNIIRAGHILVLYYTKVFYNCIISVHPSITPTTIITLYLKIKEITHYNTSLGLLKTHCQRYIHENAKYSFCCLLLYTILFLRHISLIQNFIWDKVGLFNLT